MFCPIKLHYTNILLKSVLRDWDCWESLENRILWEYFNMSSNVLVLLPWPLTPGTTPQLSVILYQEIGPRQKACYKYLIFNIYHPTNKTSEYTLQNHKVKSYIIYLFYIRKNKIWTDGFCWLCDANLQCVGSSQVEPRGPCPSLLSLTTYRHTPVLTVQFYLSCRRKAEKGDDLVNKRTDL